MTVLNVEEISDCTVFEVETETGERYRVSEMTGNICQMKEEELLEHLRMILTDVLRQKTALKNIDRVKWDGKKAFLIGKTLDVSLEEQPSPSLPDRIILASGSKKYSLRVENSQLKIEEVE